MARRAKVGTRKRVRLDKILVIRQGSHPSLAGQVVLDLEALQTFTLETVTRFLDMKGWRTWKNTEHLVMVHFRCDPDSDRESTLQLSVEGSNRSIFRMRWTSDRRVNAERFDQAWSMLSMLLTALRASQTAWMVG